MANLSALVAKTLWFAQCQPARRALSRPAVTAPQLVGVPGQRGCIVAAGLAGESSSFAGQRAHAVDLVRPRSRELDGLHFLVTASADGAGSAVAGAICSGWLWGFYLRRREWMDGATVNNKYSQELYKGQRTKERRELWGRFLLGVVVNVYKRRFFELFENRCFKCGVAELPPRQGEFQVLCVDHHIPMVLGGRLVPGNLGCLCRSCNSKKKGAPPDVFYSSVELAALEPLLQQQEKLFEFRFDRDAYDQDRVAYLVCLGVDPVEAAAAAHDPEHPDYIVPVGDSVSITLSFDMDELMCQIRGLDK